MAKVANILDMIDEWDSSNRDSADINYDYYEEARIYLGIYENLKDLYEHKWSLDRTFDTGFDSALENWLGNFKLKNERRLAFELVPKIIVYSRKEMEILCQVAYRKLLELTAHASSRIHMPLALINKSFLFIPLTDGGNYWCRHLRHLYRLASGTAVQSFNDVSRAEFSKRKYVIFVEDFVGTGNDAIRKYRKFKLEQIANQFPHLSLYYISLIGTEWGIRKISTNTRLSVICGEVLNDRYKAFNANSLIYEDERKRKKAFTAFSKYGLKLCDGDPEIDGYPLGFDDSQLTVVLYDNTPDNTLPVIWYPDKGWLALFKRNRRIHVGPRSI